jgi:hypothetical protein
MVTGGLSEPMATSAPNGAPLTSAETWHRILNAIERLQAKAPAEGEKVH